jgi:hypothetical protein
MSLKEVICPVCGKRFIPAPMHVFKTPTGSRYICTYSCVLERERRAKEKMKKARERRMKKNANEPV